MGVTVPFVLVICDGGCGTRTSIDLLRYADQGLYLLKDSVDVTVTKLGWTVEPSGLGTKKDVLHLCPSCAPQKLPTVEEVLEEVMKSSPDPHHIPTWKEMNVDNADAHTQALGAKKVRGSVKTSRSRTGKHHAVNYYIFTDRAGRDHKLHATIACTGKPAPPHRVISKGDDDMITCVKCRRHLGLKTAEIEYRCPDGHTTTHTMGIDNVLKTVVCNHQFAAEDGEGGMVTKTCMKDAICMGGK